MTLYRKTLFLIHCCIGIAGFYIPGAIAGEAKVDVCHIPPGNPDNPHTITISENALSVHLDHGDLVGACDSSQTDTVHESGPQPACACPREGVWRVKNLVGYMECNVLGIKRKIRAKGKNDGAIWVLSDDCSSIFTEAYEKEREDVIMHRGRDCLFFGSVMGEEEGAEVLFDGAYKVESEEFITGEFYLEMSAHGTTMKCEGYRPYEIEFLEPLSEKDYAKLKQKMEKKLEAAQETLADHREMLDRYLERNEGGKALGGRNADE